MKDNYSLQSSIDFPELPQMINESGAEEIEVADLSPVSSSSTYETCGGSEKALTCDLYYDVHDININFVLKKYIDLMPKEIQKKLCIYTWRGFWREFVPVTAKIPIWYTRKLYMEKMLYQARYKNIHFMHLECNILPENKKWILGCQCEYCLDYEYENELECHLAYNQENNTCDKYYTMVPSSMASNWNDKFRLCNPI